MTLTGASSVTVERGTPYSEDGATADDGLGVTLPAAPTGTVDTAVAGTYTVTYTATDMSGNTGAAARTVVVVDTTKPVVALVGSWVEYAKVYSQSYAGGDDDVYELAAAKAACLLNAKCKAVTCIPDGCTLRASDGPPFTTSLVADRVTYKHVGGSVTVERGTTYADDGATADGGEDVVTTGTVDTSAVGTYTLTYTATDVAGNVGTAQRAVDVVDTTAPTVTLAGASSVAVELGAAYYTDAGASADGGEDVVPTGTVDTLAVGTYTLTYTATDAAGNTGTAARTVVVVDTTKPVVTLVGETPTMAEVGAPYADAGAKADTGEEVVTTGVVDTTYTDMVATAVAGTYVLTYTATDASGNTGTATRTVIVVDRGAEYKLGDVGGGSCPPGYDPIVGSAEVCQAAASALGVA